MTSTYTAWETLVREPVESSDLLHDGSALRQRLRDDGYLFLRGLVPAEQVRSVCDQMLAALATCGWVRRSGPDVWELVPPPRYVGDPAYWPGYAAVQRLESLHRLAHAPWSTQLMRAIVGEDAFAQPMKVARLVWPRPGIERRYLVHQDFTSFQVPGMVTAWVPLMDCPQELGALKVLRGLHRRGAIGPDDVAELDPDWVTTDYRVGDLIMFDSMTAHTGQVNHTDRLRLSTDFRWQPASQPIPSWACRPHHAEHLPAWESLSDSWSSTRWIEVPDGVAVVEGDGGLFHRDAYRDWRPGAP